MNKKLNTVDPTTLHVSNTNVVHCDTLFSFIDNKHNSWLLYCVHTHTVFFIDPLAIEQTIIDRIQSLDAYTYYCIFTQYNRVKLEHFEQWKQLFPFKLISHSPAYFDYNIYDKEKHKQRKKQEELEQNVADITLIRGKSNVAYCLLAYKKPYLFSGEILQRKKSDMLHYNKISKSILNFLKKLPKYTIVLSSVGPIELLEFLPPLIAAPRRSIENQNITPLYL